MSAEGQGCNAMSTTTYKCPNCGGGLIFDPSTQKYKCEYCLSRFDQADLETNEEGQHEQHKEDTEEQMGYTCPSCGAEVITDPTTAATFCYYCHNPVILSKRLEGDFHPDYVVPFAIDRKKAEETFSQWIGKKRYVPKDFYAKDQIETMTGVYFPYWLYNCHVEGKLEARGTKIRTWVTGNLRYTEKKIYQIERDGRAEIHNLSRNALKKANAQLSEGVLPFSPDGLQPFAKGCLSGFIAENRDRQHQEFEQEVRQEVEQFALNHLKSSITGYSGIDITRKNMEVLQGVWKYGLFPVWTLTYKGPKDGRIYYFALNGQTGKVCGELPVDKKKLCLLFASIFFPMLMALLAVGYFL